jgi:integrase
MPLYLVYAYMSQKLVSAPIIEEFCRAIDSPSSRMQYAHRLRDFDIFLKRQYNLPVDSFVDKAKANKIDLYKIVGEYRIQLKDKQGLQDQTIASRIATTKYFLEYNDVTINNTQFRLKVRAPRRRRTKGLKALDSQLVRKIVLACQDTRLQAYVLLLACTGMRATEALSIRLRDIDWDAATVYLRAEWTKTKEDRTVFLTQECMKYLKLWKEYRERNRRIVTGGRIKHVIKLLEPNDLFFTSGRVDKKKVINPNNLYHTLAPDFRNTLDLNGLSERHDNKGKRHKVTLHRFRAFVLSTISDLGHGDYGEWFIGHSASTYYRKSDAEKLKIFKKIESYLTYLDYSALDAKGADVETKLEQKDKELQDVRSQLAELSKKLYQAGILKKD